ncbi:hypothetical protein RJ641_035716 [Dillenia turbinata]|uniref:Uncharacterized protein n=1 Tax=Dillenia turbinata TaxID=194707 RepID=A0AAN8VTL0_9MAGN
MMRSSDLVRLYNWNEMIPGDIGDPKGITSPYLIKTGRMIDGEAKHLYSLRGDGKNGDHFDAWNTEAIFPQATQVINKDN